MALTLQQLENRILHRLREPGYSATDGAPSFPVNADFPKALLDADLNVAQQVFMSDAGIPAVLSDAYVTVPVVAGLDFALPTNFAALVRVEYQIAGQGGPSALEELSFVAFDRMTGGGYDLTDSGYPEFYRRPFGGLIRLWPAPSSANVTAGDTLNLYGTTLGRAMVAPTDTPSIPQQFHEALASWCLSRYWRIKQDPGQAQLYAADYRDHVKQAKAYVTDSDPASQPEIAGDDESSEGDYLFRVI